MLQTFAALTAVDTSDNSSINQSNMKYCTFIQYSGEETISNRDTGLGLGRSGFAFWHSPLCDPGQNVSPLCMSALSMGWYFCCLSRLFRLWAHWCMAWPSCGAAHLAHLIFSVVVTRRQLITNTGGEEGTFVAPKKLTVMRIIAAEVKVVLHMQPDHIHVLLFNRHRLMVKKTHRWNYIISIDMFDTYSPCHILWSLLQFGLQRVRSSCLPAALHKDIYGQKNGWGINICQSGPSQHLSSEKCIIIFERCCLWSIINIIQLLTSDVVFSGQSNHYRFIQEELWQMS